MTFDLADVIKPDFLKKCQHPQDDIILANGSVILPDGIGTIALIFCNKDSTEKILLSGVCYCSKLDTKLISLEMLDQKELSYSLHSGILEVCDGLAPIMFGHLIAYNLYKVYLEEPTNLVTISHQAMRARTFKSAANLSVWHRQLAHLNKAAIKQLTKITLGMKITPSSNILSFCIVCVQAKITRQPHQDPQSHSTTAGFQLHVNVGGAGDTYATF